MLAPEAEPMLGNGYKLLYSFKNGSDGAYPYAGLTALNGTLYGATYGGGTSLGWGTIFKVSDSGIERVLYRFKANNDGAHPYAGLTVLGGTLYGTTYQGGSGGSGTVFKISPAGVEHVIYAFKGGSDGQYPFGRLAALNGQLYGTTYQGGASLGWGTVFRVSPSGQEHVLYRFQAGNDGAHPYAGLAVYNGALYGTTYQGGTTGSGTVFKVGPAGAERVIYSFKGGSDGQYPFARLVFVNGAFYSTTYQGGVSTGWGTVFKVTPSGEEHVVYRFKAGNDGAHPQYAGLIALNGALYGTTYQGGASGAGTVYRVSTTGVEHVIYSFKGGSDGVYPYDGVIAVNGTLYGTTYQGGDSNAGTIFKLSP
ncbi:MAG: choice-of-anchor tandem repeat GloVer-containing protein [Candidatus Baltobacteraceae bacterium]